MRFGDACHTNGIHAAAWHGIAARALLAISAVGLPACNRVGDELDASPVHRIAAEPLPRAEEASDDDLVSGLNLLRKRGDFEGFIDATLNAAEPQPENAPLQLLKSEALLAAGRNEDAAAAADVASQSAIDAGDPALAAAALKLWSIARFRQRQSLQTPEIDSRLKSLSGAGPAVELLRYWSAAIGERAYRISSAPAGSRSEVTMARVAELSIPAELNAIEAKANGVSMPLVFIDTGTQHTLMTIAAAKAAGVEMGASDTQLVGFGNLVARPGVIETLQLGQLILHDVPVLVGDSKPLLTSEGQMALGTELMHHVRFVLDYPGHKVFVEPAASPGAFDLPPVMSVPLWTFSQVCLARGRTARGTFARVLVDTGDRAGTFVSARWAQKNLSHFPRPNATMVFKHKRRDLSLDDLEVGGISFHEWPVEDTMPRDLERLDLVDLLFGHDLLGSYELTIDLRRQVLELRESPGDATPVQSDEN